MHSDVDELRLGEWRISPRRNALTRGAEVRHIEPKAMDLLVCLLAHRGEVVSIDQILKEVWPGRVVEPSGIHQRIFHIRRALGDDARQPKYVESVRKRGYRIRAAGQHAFEDVAAGNRSSLRVAVLPLQDLTPHGNLGWLTGGLAEELRSQIDGWPQFTVLPGAFSRDWRTGDSPEPVDVLVEGSVQLRRPTGVSVHLEVTDLNRKVTIWTRRFDGAHEHPLELQLQIAESIARFFGESTGGNPAPRRPEAYGAFLRLLNYRYFGAFDEHVYWLERTLELDPDWDWGWGDLAIALIRCASMRRDESLLERARHIVRSTPRGGDGRGILALAEYSLKAYCDDDLPGAESIARELACGGYGYPYGTLLVSSGLHRQAEAYFRRYTERKPYRPVGWEWLSLARANAGDWRGALDAARHVERLFPSDAPGTPIVISWSIFEGAEADEAACLLEHLKALRDQQQPSSVHRRVTEVLGYYNLAFRIAEARRDNSAALAAAEWFADHGFGFHAGVLYLRLRDPRAESALASVDPRFDRYYGWVTSLMIPPELREHPLIRATMTRFGFSQRWRDRLEASVATLPAACGF